MPMTVFHENLHRLGWEPVIVARLLGCSHTTLRRFTSLSHSSPPPNVLVAAFCALPHDAVDLLGKRSWPEVRRPLNDGLVWRWRARLCCLAEKHGVR